MIKMTIPNLQIKDTNTAAYDLKRLLIPGGAAINVRSKAFVDFNATCDWSSVDPQRLTFITECHDAINTFDSQTTSEGHASNLKTFVAWCDKNHKTLAFDEEAFKALYLAYDVFLYNKANDKEIKMHTAYTYMISLSDLARRVFDNEKIIKGDGLAALSRCVKAYKAPARTAVSLSAEKQSFSDTQVLGYYCVDVCKAITTENLLAPLPIVYTLEETDQQPEKQYQFPWNLKPFDKLSKKDQWSIRKKRHQHESRYPADTINGERHRTALAKLRVFAEFMIFLFQTGSNVKQALMLKRERFQYKLQGETEWLVTVYKARKGDTVSFTIFRDYKGWFKAYLAFCDEHFPDDPYLFPAISNGRGRKKGVVETSTFRSYFKAHGIPWMPPSKIRNTRVNYLLRISGDPERTAEVHGHTVVTLKQNYMQPSQQRSASALTVFWKDGPVSRIKSGCDRQPQAVIDKPADVVEPDCTHASGCLWCEKHRDIESFDYVWNLTSFKHLKVIEAGQLKKGDIPADKTIERCIEKLDAFKEEHDDWVEKAQLRVDEGDYHTTWKGLIDFKEAT
jgi:hypothetical protein